MNFYKIVTIIAIVILIIFLTITGVVLNSSSKEKIIFPPYISMCPDYYVYNENSDECQGPSIISSSLTTTIDDNPINCNNFRIRNKKIDDSESDEDITGHSFNQPGMGPNSGICAKKKWANGCNVHWDGITNNEDVCNKKNTENLNLI